MKSAEVEKIQPGDWIANDFGNTEFFVKAVETYQDGQIVEFVVSRYRKKGSCGDGIDIERSDRDILINQNPGVLHYWKVL